MTITQSGSPTWNLSLSDTLVLLVTNDKACAFRGIPQITRRAINQGEVDIVIVYNVYNLEPKYITNQVHIYLDSPAT